MKLYFAPMTLSLSPRIVLKELGVDFKLVRINNKTKITEGGDDFIKINPKGYVAALELGDSEVITEGPAILTYIIEKFNWKTINNTKICNIRLLEWLCFISSELHGGSAPLFNDLIPDEVKNILKKSYIKDTII
ncbi:glutathione S-transferase N-terminal domain-containing protein [Rosenbergiella epipactidis]|uniref:glutathione S-transferase N-terminal domain-containing protein n=1 Tax=Rosenbergiella epipactidis TaxID=1544694 RepID=UPI0030C7A5A6